jgi:hypothetical protein
MNGSTEYVVAGRAPAAYESLAEAVRERHLPVVRADERHLTLEFGAEGHGWGEEATVRCTVLDAGHGLSKLVLSGIRHDGSVVSLGGPAAHLLTDVEQRLHARAGDAGGSKLVRP